MLQSFLTYLRRPVDAAALAYFRVAFGLLMVAEMLRYLSKSRVREFWIEPGFHFKYYGFAPLISSLTRELNSRFISTCKARGCAPGISLFS